MIKNLFQLPFLKFFMIPKRKLAIFLLVVLTGVLYWFYTGQFIDSGNNLESFVVERVIDGDTVVLNDSSKVRMLGINTPESKMLLYEDARDFLEGLVLNRTILLDRGEKDRYGRVLGYIFIGGNNVNELILENGFGNLYYYGADEYYKNMKAAEGRAREAEKGIWKRSSNYGCLGIEEFIWLDETEKDSERLVLKNSCGSFDVVIKDDATHIYKEQIDSVLVLETKDIWNDDGDSLYVWDDNGLVLFERY